MHISQHSTQPLRQLRRRVKTVEELIASVAETLYAMSLWETNADLLASMRLTLEDIRATQIAMQQGEPRALALVCDAGCDTTYSADPAAYPRFAPAQVLHCNCGSVLHLAYVNEREERIVVSSVRRRDLDTPRPQIENL